MSIVFVWPGVSLLILTVKVFKRESNSPGPCEKLIKSGNSSTTFKLVTSFVPVFVMIILKFRVLEGLILGSFSVRFVSIKSLLPGIWINLFKVKLMSCWHACPPPKITVHEEDSARTGLAAKFRVNNRKDKTNKALFIL